MKGDVPAVTDGRTLGHEGVGIIEEVVGEIPARLLTDECPRYTVEPAPRAEPAPVAAPSAPETMPCATSISA